MKKFVSFLIIALFAIITLSSCEKDEIEEVILTTTGSTIVKGIEDDFTTVGMYTYNELEYAIISFEGKQSLTLSIQHGGQNCYSDDNKIVVEFERFTLYVNVDNLVDRHKIKQFFKNYNK